MIWNGIYNHVFRSNFQYIDASLEEDLAQSVKFLLITIASLLGYFHPLLHNATAVHVLCVLLFVINIISFTREALYRIKYKKWRWLKSEKG